MDISPALARAIRTEMIKHEAHMLYWGGLGWIWRDTLDKILAEEAL